MPRTFVPWIAAAAAASLLIVTNTPVLAGGPLCAPDCSADVGGNGSVDVDDLVAVILGWGACPAPCPPACAEDVAPLGAPDCHVNVDDLIAVILGWGACPTPAGDNCALPQSINHSSGTLGSITFCTSAATTDGPAEPSCNFCCSDPQIHKDVWYSFVTNQFGPDYWAWIDTCGSDFDTKIAVYRVSGISNCTCPGAGSSMTLVACNDDIGDGSACHLQSRVQFQYAPTSCYLIRVGGYDGQSGTAVLRFGTFRTGDECFNAIDLGVVTASNPLTASDFTPFNYNPGYFVTQAPCTNFNDGYDVWYKFQIGCGGNVLGSVNTCDPFTDYDTILTLYHGSCDGLTLIGCNDDSTLPPCQLNGLPRKSLVDLPSDADAGYYYVRISGYQGATGSYHLNVGLSCIN